MNCNYQECLRLKRPRSASVNWLPSEQQGRGIYSLLFSYQNLLPCPHRVVSYLRHIFESHPETLHEGIMEGAGVSNLAHSD